MRLLHIIEIKIRNFEKLGLTSLSNIHGYAEFLPSLLLQCCGTLENYMIDKLNAIPLPSQYTTLIDIIFKDKGRDGIGENIITSIKQSKIKSFCKIVSDGVSLDQVQLKTINDQKERIAIITSYRQNICHLIKNINLQNDFNTALNFLEQRDFHNQKKDFFEMIDTIVDKRNEFAHGLLPLGKLSPLSFSQYFYFIGYLLLLENVIIEFEQLHTPPQKS